MKKTRTWIAIPLLFSVTGWAAADEMESYQADAAQAVQMLFQQLKERLGSAMGTGGPPHAIAACHEDAQKITEQVSAATGWTVGRTSLRLRNPENRPDAWERQVLAEFEARRVIGEPLQEIAYMEVVEEGGQERVRFMKVIPTGEVCLSCHGSDLSAEVRAQLDALYPEDQATGFQQGEIRGAFTLSRVK